MRNYIALSILLCSGILFASNQMDCKTVHQIKRKIHRSVRAVMQLSLKYEIPESARRNVKHYYKTLHEYVDSCSPAWDKDSSMKEWDKYLYYTRSVCCDYLTSEVIHSRHKQNVHANSDKKSEDALQEQRLMIVDRLEVIRGEIHYLDAYKDAPRKAQGFVDNWRMSLLMGLAHCTQQDIDDRFLRTTENPNNMKRFFRDYLAMVIKIDPIKKRKKTVCHCAR